MGFQGILKEIYIGTQSGQPMEMAESANAIAGKGLDTDRYATGEGTFAKPGVPDNEVTFIEAEAIAATIREYDLDLTAAETRRNLVTEGVPLNHLVDREFQVGNVRFRGIRLCEPCGHLEKHLNKPVVEALRHRGGLRAQVLTSGNVTSGDRIEAMD